MLDICLDLGLFLLGMIVGATINTYRYKTCVGDYDDYDDYEVINEDDVDNMLENLKDDDKYLFIGKEPGI